MFTNEEIREEIKGRLENYKGNTYCLDEIGYLITESENCNGSWYCSTCEAEEELGANFSFFFDIVEYWEEMTGEELNPFKNPELVHCKLLIIYFERIFNLASQDIDSHEVTIDDEFIDLICDNINHLNLKEIF